MTKRFFTFAFALLISFFLFAETNTIICTLDRLQDILDDENAHSDSFSIEGTVTHPAGSVFDELTLTDGKTHLRPTDGMRPFIPWLKAGDRIQASGRIIRQNGNLYNYAKAFAITRTGTGDVPSPVDADIGTVASGGLENRLVRIGGLLVDVFRDETDPRFVFFVLKDREQHAYLTLLETNGIDQLSRAIGSGVTATGICRKERPGRKRSHLDISVFLSSLSDLKIVRPAPADPYAVPELKGGISTLRAEGGDTPWRKVCGTVLAAFRKDQVLLQTVGGSVSRLTLVSDRLPECGCPIEAVGMPETDFYNLNLSRAIWRQAKRKPSFTNRTETVSASFLLSDAFGRRQIKAELHGRIVRLRGKITHIALDTTESTRMTLKDGDTEIPVEFGTGVPLPEGIDVGCSIEVSGVCFMETDNWRPQQPFPRIRSVSVIVRKTDDLRILEFPPWWTTRRLFTVIGILLISLTGILVWNVLLQRLSDRKGRALAKARLASSENLLKVQERTRLATELHDTIVQNLTGASMELRTASRVYDSNPESSRQQLSLAIMTLDSCRNEIRNCIWDLRSRALDESTMDAAIRRTLAPFEGDAQLTIRFSVPRNRLTDNTAHSLICIVRELVANAIRHGKARSIRIAGCIDKGNLLFSVQDDGCGFDPVKAPGISQGHFGLQGVGERIELLHGSFSVTSTAGKGTRVSLSVPLVSEGKN